ncbi:MAG: hypothetical protein M3421_06740 [Bacteroidota bacterium]|jgi:hypothetical protein|nr:hypothetical protein [Bacteroidota bacterium]
MKTTDLYLERDKVFVLLDNAIAEVDYDSLEVGTPYYVVTQTMKYSIYKKMDTFDDDFVRLEQDKHKAEAILNELLREVR